MNERIVIWLSGKEFKQLIEDRILNCNTVNRLNDHNVRPNKPFDEYDHVLIFKEGFVYFYLDFRSEPDKYVIAELSNEEWLKIQAFKSVYETGDIK